jgi:hypothetical protein
MSVVVRCLSDKNEALLLPQIRKPSTFLLLLAEHKNMLRWGDLHMLYVQCFLEMAHTSKVSVGEQVGFMRFLRFLVNY